MICLQFRRVKFTVHVSQIVFCCVLMSNLKFLTGFLLKFLLGPLTWARLAGWISPGVHMRNFNPVSGMKKGQRSWDEFWRQNRQTKRTWRNTKILTFALIIASATLKAVSLQLNGMLMIWKIQQVMQDDAMRAARIHPAVHPGNRAEVFIWQNFPPA